MKEQASELLASMRNDQVELYLADCGRGRGFPRPPRPAEPPHIPAPNEEPASMDLREKRHHADLRPLDLRPLLLVRGQLRCSADEEAKPRTKRKEVVVLSSSHLGTPRDLPRRRDDHPCLPFSPPPLSIPTAATVGGSRSFSGCGRLGGREEAADSGGGEEGLGRRVRRRIGYHPCPTRGEGG
jgi:hypothetical protein